MNVTECNILNALYDSPFTNQRNLAERSGCSLGIVCRCLQSLQERGYIDNTRKLTDKTRAEFATKSPQRAIILAAGFGMRMAPINFEYPKAFIKVHGEPLIERVIRQLHEVGIREIYIVVGFMKERFEYLIDEFEVELIVNPAYSSKNNLHSLNAAAAHLERCYVIPCDVWCAENPFSKRELYSWYMLSERSGSGVRANRKSEIILSEEGNAPLGIAYLTADTAKIVRERTEALCRDSRYDGEFWESALFDGQKMILTARVVKSEAAFEINTYEQLRVIDGDSDTLKSDKISVIADTLHADSAEIRDITVLKKGMTNRSFLFTCRGEKYIMRIPGEGTDKLISRREEAEVFRVINGLGICEDILYINPENGYKISRFIENAHTCDPFNPEETQRCMRKLREFHEMGLKTTHEFDIFAHIEYYESLWNGINSAYGDYERTKAGVMSLKPYVEKHCGTKVLTHIDAVPDNFLFSGEDIYLIDWEYAGMQDPHVDIAMFCVYAMYDKPNVDRLIDEYFEGKCPDETRIKIYCYISACGLLWSNWCEYKQQLGVEFGEYSLRQYRFAKDYYKLVRKEAEIK